MPTTSDPVRQTISVTADDPRLAQQIRQLRGAVPLSEQVLQLSPVVAVRPELVHRRQLGHRVDVLLVAVDAAGRQPEIAGNPVVAELEKMPHLQRCFISR